MGEAVAGSRKMWRKRQEIRRDDCLSEAEFAACLRNAEKAAVDSIMRRRSAQGKGNGLLRTYQILFG